MRKSVAASARSPGAPDADDFEEGRLGKILSVVIPLLVVCVALYVLHDLTREVRWHDVKTALQNTASLDIGLAIGYTALSFLALCAYEVLAVAIVAPGRVRSHIAAIAGAISYAISNLLGFSVLTGGALRYRIYAAEGLDFATVTGVFATSWVTLWAGLATVAGIALVIDPTGVPLLETLSPAEERLTGVVLLGVVLAFLLWIGAGERRIAFRSIDLPLPTLPLALLQILAAIIDVSGAALACYVLLPSDVPPGFAGFFVVYVAATAAGIVSHTPGGLGTFEAIIMVGLDAADRADVLAALLLYRLVYYVLPFVVAAVTLSAVTLQAHEARLRKGGATLVAALRPLTPPLAAGVAFIAGMVLLISGALPAENGRLGWLRDTLPLSIVELSHLIGSVVGVSLLVIARGLYRRLRRAWVITLGLLIAGALASLLKGVDFEEAVALSAGALILIALRSAFYRRADADPFTLSLGWMISIVTTVGATVWIGLFAYRHVFYANELWWEFAWEGDAPRFLRAGVAVAVAVLAFGLHSWVSWRRPAEEPDPITDDVRTLVSASPDTEANLALLGDKRFLTDADRKAFIMYAAVGGSLIAKGDPIGDEDAGRRLAWDFREVADRAGLRCAFYAVGTRYLPAYLDMGLALLKLGEVARIDLSSFTLDGAAKRDFRNAKNRARRDGFEFAIIPAAEVPAHLAQLRAVSDAWLSHKQGREKNFALGRFDDAYLSNFDHAILRHGDGRVVAFANLWKGSAQEELSLDLMRYDNSQLKVAMDALFAEILLWGREQGYGWFNLGAAPFAGFSDHPLATTWNRFGRVVYRYGQEVYGFEGLRAFKEKFAPVWTPHYLACPGGLATPKVLLEVNRLVSGGIRGLALR